MDQARHQQNPVQALFSEDYYRRHSSVYDLEVAELNETSQHTATPEGALITLKPHQETLLHRCIQFENDDILLNEYPQFRESIDDTHSLRVNMGVIADRVGSGKSYVILSLIKSNDITQRQVQDVRSFGMNAMIFQRQNRETSLKTNMLVIPHNLPHQWDKTIQDYGAGIKYLMMTRKKVFENVMNGITKIEDFDLIVVTSTFYRHIASYLREKELTLQRLIFDEIDNVVIQGCLKIKAKFYWFVTASYGNLLYPRGYDSYDRTIGRYISYSQGIRTTGFVKTMFAELADQVPKEIMKILIVKNTEAYVQSSIQLPEINSIIIRCLTPISVRVLNGFVDRNILSALNAGDTTSAINMLSPNRRLTENNIINIMINRYNRDLHNCTLRLRMMEEMTFETEVEKQEMIGNINRTIKDLTEKIQSIQERIQNNDACRICYDQIENKSVVECCQNSFCFKCISMWLNNRQTCPMCRSGLGLNNMFVVNPNGENEVIVEENDDEDIMNPDYAKTRDKYQNLKSILQRRKTDPQFKCLLFSCFDTSFHKIAPILDELRMKWSYVKGRGDVINNIVKHYKESDLQVLLINVHDYGSGLNLENTSDIIMFHKFDSEIEKQVIGRAHRMGRSNSLSVWYLLHENE